MKGSQMAEANARLSSSLMLMQRAVMVEAQRKAVYAATRQYQARRLKLYQISRRDYLIAAEQYLREHPELITAAAQAVELWRKEGFFGKRAMQCAPLERFAQTAKA
jgi:hypothetical protein